MYCDIGQMGGVHGPREVIQVTKTVRSGGLKEEDV